MGDRTYARSFPRGIGILPVAALRILIILITTMHKPIPLRSSLHRLEAYAAFERLEAFATDERLEANATGTIAPARPDWYRACSVVE
jgi:hypothetical protein